LIEDKASGTALIQELRERKAFGVPSPIAITPKLEKLTRVHSETPAMESGKVLLKAAAPWLADLKSEIAQFPNGRHDDQIDSMTQFLSWARGARVPKFGIARIR
jgi:predicted phage terminase large subunit-like protein